MTTVHVEGKAYTRFPFYRGTEVRCQSVVHLFRDTDQYGFYFFRIEGPLLQVYRSKSLHQLKMELIYQAYGHWEMVF